MSSRLVITSHHPARQRRRWLAMILIMSILAWAVFQVGQRSALVDNVQLREERVSLQHRLEAVVKENQDLRERLAVLERSAQVDRQAYGEVERSLKEAQDEMLELKEEVAFYRGIVSPAETASGLSVTRFQVANMGEPGVFRFKLVLTQLRNNNRVVKGYATLAFEGIRNSKQTHLGLKDISHGAQDHLKLRFKYFQNIEGDIVLPKGFLPSRVILEVVPGGNDWKRFKKSFDWSDIIH